MASEIARGMEVRIVITPGKGSGRGFQSMSDEKRRNVASKGGKVAHAQGKEHRWNSETAKAASKKGWDVKKGIKNG